MTIHRSKEYLHYIRVCPCMICGRPAIAHHEDTLKSGGTGAKGHDGLCLPLCHVCHDARHRMGFDSFWQQEGFGPADVMREQLRYLMTYLIQKGI